MMKIERNLVCLIRVDFVDDTTVWLQVWMTVVLWMYPWWRHQMETFSALLAIRAGNSPVPGEFPALRPVTRSLDVFLFYLRLNKRLSKQSWGWWFEPLSHPLWRHRNVTGNVALAASGWTTLLVPYHFSQITATNLMIGHQIFDELTEILLHYSVPETYFTNINIG